jgi:hypothetical protein
MLENPILVSDEEIKDGDFVLLPYSYEVRRCVNGTTFIEETKKIIGGFTSLPSIAFSDKASNQLQKMCGWVDIQKLAERAFVNTEFASDAFKTLAIMDFVKGVKEYRSASDKKFSEHDVWAIITLYELKQLEVLNKGIGDFNARKIVEDVIKLFSHPKIYEVELDMELRDVDEVYFELQSNYGDYWNHHFHFYDSGRRTIKKHFEYLYSVPKIIDNSIRVNEIKKAVSF